ncbi:MAG: ABC transporter substrate-binding protein [Rhodanobacter sp.]
MKYEIISLCAAVGLSFAGTVSAQSATSAPCPHPITVQGFKTCADVQKAEQEGEVVLYSPDVERGTVKVLAAFKAAFPKINTKYLRLQTGALYSKLMAERQAKSFLVDVVNLSDVGLALDFQKRGGYDQYHSPELSAYESRFKSKPEGFFTWGCVIMAGIAYNPATVKPVDAPKDWKDLLDPKWAGGLSVKSANSGLQHTTWYELREVLGKDYWERFAKQKPRAFDSYVQQYDRLSNGEDKLTVTAQYSGFLEFKAKGAPIEFIAPPTGLPAGPEVIGVANNAPHPQAARLFLDWFLSPLGQKVNADAIFNYSARTDVDPPPGGIHLSKMKLLVPNDWDAYVKSRKEFVELWGRLSGLR